VVRWVRWVTQAPAVTTVPKDTTVVLVLGMPGAGKTSVCEQLHKEGSYVHIPASELLKEEMAAGTKVCPPHIVRACARGVIRAAVGSSMR
jgi:dephospho-CoA kinase